MTIITTHSGQQVDIESPVSDCILIEDIAHALSFLCRGSGQANFFFSVARHCVYCALEAEARGFSREVVLACLLHDASEAYLSDVTRPVKAEMPRYKEIEAPLQELIWNKWLVEPLDTQELIQVFQIDDAILAYEFLNHNLVSVVASDAHSAAHRPPNLGKAMERIAKQCGAEAARILQSNARAIFAGETLLPQELHIPRRFLGFWV